MRLAHTQAEKLYLRRVGNIHMPSSFIPTFTIIYYTDSTTDFWKGQKSSIETEVKLNQVYV